MSVLRRPAEVIYCKVEARPKNDDGYFEQMAKAVFRSGFNWQVIEKKWPDFQKAFSGFSIQKVAKFNEDDIDRLMKDKGVVRNYRKIIMVVSFLRSVGEEMPEINQLWMEKHLKVRRREGYRI